MASTYENDLRLEEMATGENSGSWGTKTNTNLELIADAFSYGTETIADADTTITIADGAADAARSLALKINSSADLTTTRTITLAPNTTSKVWIIENNTSGGQTLTISAGSGSNITLANGTTKIIATDGIGAGSNVVELTQDLAIADMSVDGILSLADGSNSAPSLTNTGDTNTGLYFPAADEVGITTGGTQRVKVDSTGVNITGTLVSDGLTVDGTATITTTGNETQLTLTSTDADATTGPNMTFYRNSASPAVSDQTGSIFFIGKDDAGNDATYGGITTHIVDASNLTEDGRLTISSMKAGTLTETLHVVSGNVGIGTSSPSVVLDARLGGTSGKIAELHNSVGYGIGFTVESDGGVNTINAESNQALAFATNGASNERMRIDSSGNVGIGTSSPSRSLHISGGTNSMVIERTDATTSALLLVAESNNTAIYSRASNASTTARDLIFNMGSTERMRITSSGSVGIGTSDISGFGGTYKGLDVAYKGSGLAGRTDNPTFDMRSNLFYDGSNYKYGEGNTTAGILSVGGAQLIFSNAPSGTAGATATVTERMRIDSSGNVGIGTTSPALSAGYTTLAISGSSNSGWIQLMNGGTSVADWYSSGGTESTFRSHSGGLNFTISGSDAFKFVSNSSERMRIDGSGSVGIGSTSPIGSAQRLYIDHPASTQTALPTVKIRRANNVGGGSALPEIALDVSVPSTYNNATEVYGIKTYAAHNLTGTGCFGIYSEVEKGNSDNHHAGFFRGGHSDTNGISVPKVVYIDQTTTVGASNVGYSIGCMIKQDDYTNNEFMRWDTGYSGSDTMNALRIYRNGSQIGGITTTTSSTAYNTSSDYRLKENVTYDWDATTRLKQLKPARFNFIADADTTVDGFLAHEAQTVVPEAVTGTHNEVDDDGNAVMQGIDQSKLVPLLTAALQEAIAKIEDLEARVAALENA